MSKLPILYSFRRCPFAMRARAALWASKLAVELREIDLHNKPEALLALAPKATVPLLQLGDGTLIKESRDIMNWALTQKDPQNWLGSQLQMGLFTTLIDQNDFDFKIQLDRYKYPDRFQKNDILKARDQCESFIKTLEHHLNTDKFLHSKHLAQADIAIFPFVRQFSMVDPDWFANQSYPKLKIWLKNLVDSDLFIAIMQKYPLWHPQNKPSYFCLSTPE